MGAVDSRAGGLEPRKLGTNMLVDWLIDERKRGRQSPVRAQAAEGDDRTAAAALDVGNQPLELAHLVASPTTGAEGAVFLDPDTEAIQPADRRRVLGQYEVRKRLRQNRKALVQEGPGHAPIVVTPRADALA